MFIADELRKIIDAADQPLEAMILLALNCAYGAADLSNLPQTALDLRQGWATFPRVKTAVPRRAKLWAETVAAVREALAERPPPRDPADDVLVFVTRRGKRWLQLSASQDRKKWAARQDLIAREFRSLLDTLGINGGRGFYCLRRTFQTIAEETSGDFPALGHVMGHAPKQTDMSARYRQRISDERLNAVATAVHGWLFPADTAKAGWE